jgi:4-hydroxybenzoate polyprenyltransferase
MYLGPAVAAMFITSFGALDLLVAIPVAIAIYFVALATYMYNDVTDISVDKMNSYRRPLVSGKANVEELLKLTALFYVGATILIYATNIYATLTLLSFIALGIFYSHPKTSLKEKFPHKTITTALGGALASLTGGLAAGSLSPYLLYASAVSFLFLLVMGPIADISDLKGDRAAGRRTFPLVLGVNRTLMIMTMVILGIMTFSVLSLASLHMNLIGLGMILAIGSAAVVTLRLLMKRWNSPESVWQTRNRMKVLNLLLQLSLVVGVFQII